MIQAPPLAHSAPNPDRKPHLYADHVREATRSARANAEAVAAHMDDKKQAARLTQSVVDAATYHDLGKLDPDNQAALRSGRAGRMRWDHVDAGAACLLRSGADAAAWIVRAHHAPGLPAAAAEFNPLDPGASRGLRGGRVGARDSDEADALIAHTDRTLDDLVARQATAAGEHAPTKAKAKHGLFMRLALSCVVDGDHSDAAGYEHGWRVPDPPAPRWEERLAQLDAYVANLPSGDLRQRDRSAFYRACREGPVDAPMAACEGPVGIGKTTAVAAWCLRRAIASGARRLFVVAPYTTILSQTAATLRRALVLPDETGREDEVLGEHHHRAEFQALASRDLAVLWRAPIVVTTGVQFFETLAACEPARLRKLHSLPGSVVFVDEAHAALPAPLWRQNWAWMRELAERWGCSFVFASGSLARVWEEPDIVGENGKANIPDIARPELMAQLNAAEHARVRYRTLGRVADPCRAILDCRPGPRLVVVNTVQTAAVIANDLRASGADVLHLSTALCPSDRDLILKLVKQRLEPKSGYGSDWTLVATSLVEAGVDLSFRTALRERFSTASLIQVGGRVNRHGGDEAGEVLDFQINADKGLTSHPGAKASAAVLERWFRERCFDRVVEPASLVTRALREELRDEHGQSGMSLACAEQDRDYPEVARCGKLIDEDTELMVVDQVLLRALEDGERVSSRTLLAGSVQVRQSVVERYCPAALRRRPEIFAWRLAYDPDFLGYMAGVLPFLSGKAFLI